MLDLKIREPKEGGKERGREGKREQHGEGQGEGSSCPLPSAFHPATPRTASAPQCPSASEPAHRRGRETRKEGRKAGNIQQGEVILLYLKKIYRKSNESKNMKQQIYDNRLIHKIYTSVLITKQQKLKKVLKYSEELLYLNNKSCTLNSENRLHKKRQVNKQVKR